MSAATPAPSGDRCAPELTDVNRDDVEKYAKELGPELQKRYGKKPHYTPEEVRTAASGGGYNLDYICWADCLYCTPADFSALHATTDGSVCGYESMRSVVSTSIFDGADLGDAISVFSLAEGFVGAAEVAGGAVDVAGAFFDVLGGIGSIFG